MRRLIIMVAAVALLAPMVGARRKKEKAGEVKDRVFVDKKYDFKLSLSEGWKYKVRANKEYFRLVLIQVNYETPPQYLDAPDYTLIPRTVIYVDTTSMSPRAFIDSLLSENYKSKQKKEIYREFDILNEHAAGSGMTRERLVSRRKKTVKIAGERGLHWIGQVKYRNDIPESAASTDLGANKRVYGAFSGSIVAVKKGNVIILFHTICERDYFENVLKETMTMINTLEWVG